MYYATGVIDSSGIKFHVTKELRQFDAGIMELGLEYTDKYAIPPGQPLFNLVGYCIPQCTALVRRVDTRSKAMEITYTDVCMCAFECANTCPYEGQSISFCTLV